MWLLALTWLALSWLALGRAGEIVTVIGVGTGGIAGLRGIIALGRLLIGLLILLWRRWWWWWRRCKQSRLLRRVLSVRCQLVPRQRLARIGLLGGAALRMRLRMSWMAVCCAV